MRSRWPLTFVSFFLTFVLMTMAFPSISEGQTAPADAVTAATPTTTTLPATTTTVAPTTTTRPPTTTTLASTTTTLPPTTTTLAPTTTTLPPTTTTLLPTTTTSPTTTTTTSSTTTTSIADATTTTTLPPAGVIVDDKDVADAAVRFSVLSGSWRASRSGRNIWPLSDRTASYRWTDSRSRSGDDRNDNDRDADDDDGDDDDSGQRNSRSESRVRNLDASAQWTCSTLPPGRYEVFAWWPSLRERMAGNVPYVIYCSGTSTTVRVNQGANGGKWNSLGVYNVDATGVRVVIANSRTTWWNTRVVADAIKIVPAP